MKQLFFLLLFPCLALAQYPNNGNQKITLGEQTSADGLVYRGVANIDTVTATSKITRVNKQDTSAFILLDTVTNLLWHYKTASNGWIQAGGGVSVSSFSAGTTGLTPSTATTGAVTLGGTLALTNGGTGSETKNFVDLTTAQTVAGNKGFTGKISIGTSNIDNTSGLVVAGNITSGSNQNVIISDASMNGSNTNTSITANAKLAPSTNANNTIGIAISNAELLGTGGTKATTQNNYALYIYNQTSGTNNNYAIKTFAGINSFMGSVGIGVDIPTEILHVVGNARITDMNNIVDIGASSTGVLQAAGASDVNLKNTIENSSFGLNEILLLNPVTFFYNDLDRKMDNDVKDVGFIAQDVFDIIPNAVSSMGDGDLQLDYRAITATLVKAVQEQQALIKALEQRIINLENK